MKLAITLALALLLVGCKPSSENVTAKIEGPATPQPAPAPAPPPHFPVQDFDLATKKISSSQLPLDGFQVYELASELAPPKDKFESSKDFERRMKEVSSKTLKDNLKIGGLIAFYVYQDRVRIDYDADKELFSFQVAPEASVSYKWDLIEVSRRSLSGENREVHLQYFAEKGKLIRFAEVVYLSIPAMKKGLVYPSGSAKVSRADAPGMERSNSLKVLAVGRLVAPFAHLNVHLPFGDNETTLEERKILVFKPEGFWLVNVSDGTVLSKSFTLKPI